MKEGLIIDCFAGGGGASVGIEMALGRQVDIEINHDPDAILMHKTNHPDTMHMTEDIFKVDLQKYVKGRHVSLMWASPDCTSHSKAKGGQPRQHGLRILPWAVYKHAKSILPDVIIMENVEEIQQWGPLDNEGHPIPERKGEDYRKFITTMKSLGYLFDSRELVAADYGAPTTRKRWYAIFRRDGREIVWPEPTHSKGGLNSLEPWEPIYKYLDLWDVGKSIFVRKKTLAENTMKRIARGLEKFVFNCPDPFIVQVNHGGDNFRGQSIHEPMPTITQKHGFAKVTPYIMQIGQTGFTKDRNRTVVEPISTVVTKNEHCLISPLLIQYHSETTKSGVRGQQVTSPIQTIDTSNRYGLVMSYLTKFYKSGTGQGMSEPIHTITTSPGHFGTVSVLAMDWKKLQEAGIDEDAAEKCTWVSQFVMEYYGCGTGQGLKEPIHTIVTKDRFALLTVLGNEYVILDIFLRMLKPEELKLGQGFPKDYVIDRDYNGNRYPVSKQVARIGNSVVPIMAQKLVEANCGYLKIGERQPVWQIKNFVEEKNGQMRLA
ncbi:DNA cytosine methyltransferase [Schaedlerella arabinosiphila]|uniref:DNA cytosine methyltransferase n=1 Tax=Schaedlerella arabinosiphila TaxID=2044587 RepID=UPI002557F949|nr:DNA cytosine methyltransferase [Schaedlerella arabinosiphila]